MEGYASVFGNVDSHGDIVMPSAFNKTVNDWKNCNPARRRIKVLSQHNRWEPIGIPTDLKIDKVGLYTFSKISRTVEGEKTLILARDGVLTEMSIGYLTILESYNEDKRANELNELRLMEYSPVTWGSNELTTIDNVKHMLKEYSYSGGNVLEVFADALLEQVKTIALNNNSEPSRDTQSISKSLADTEVDELLIELKNMKRSE